MSSFAFAGAGPAAALWGEAVRVAPGHRLIAVAAPSVAGAGRVAVQMQAETCRYDDLPAGADVVIIASPPNLHAEHALAALRAGSAVIVERPLAVTLEEADLLVAASDAGARIAYGENLLFSPLVRDALHRIRALGPLTHLDARVLQQVPPRERDRQGVRGGGALLELGSQLIAVLLVTVGADRPVEVSATLTPSSDGPWDDGAELTIRLASGVRTRLTASWRAELPVWDLQVATAWSALRLELLPHPHVEQLGVDLPLPPIRFHAEHQQLERYGYIDRLVELAEELSTGSRPYLDARFGRAVLEIVCAASRSGAIDAPVSLPFRGPRDRTPQELATDR